MTRANNSHDGEQTAIHSKVQILLENDKFETLHEIGAMLKYTHLAKSLGMNYQTCKRRIKDPNHLSINDIRKLAQLFNVHPSKITRIIFPTKIPIPGNEKPGGRSPY
jgi:hypothetical protein